MHVNHYQNIVSILAQISKSNATWCDQNNVYGNALRVHHLVKLYKRKNPSASHIGKFIGEQVKNMVDLDRFGPLGYFYNDEGVILFYLTQITPSQRPIMKDTYGIIPRKSCEWNIAAGRPPSPLNLEYF
jgi:hypothetical protein